MRRAIVVWTVLFAAYAAMLGTDARPGTRYNAAEAHYLSAAKRIVEDGHLDRSAQGVGFPLLISPAYALGGETAVELFCAALAALGFVLAAALARRLVPDPWATAGPLIAGLSLPALAYGSAVHPELIAGTLLAGAALLALRVREHPTSFSAAAAGALLALLPWLSPAFLAAGAVIALATARWLLSRRRGMAALVGGEVVLASLVIYIQVNDNLFGGTTPYAALPDGQAATGSDSAGDFAGRAYRAIALWIDRDYGLLRWAPFLGLAFFSVWLLWRWRRDRVSKAVPEHADAEATARLMLAVCAAQVAVAVFLAPTMFGGWFPGRQVIAVLPCAAVLCAWGLRHAPRTGAVLATATLATSLWYCAELRLDERAGWAEPAHSSAPLGPLERALPSFD